MSCETRSGSEAMDARGADGPARTYDTLRATALFMLRKPRSIAVIDEHCTRGGTPMKMDGVAGEVRDPKDTNWPQATSATSSRVSRHQKSNAEGWSGDILTSTRWVAMGPSKNRFQQPLGGLSAM